MPHISVTVALDSGLPRTSVSKILFCQLSALTFGSAVCNAQDNGLSRLDHQLVAAGINAAVGGLTAGAWQGLSGKSFWNGFARGAGGGIMVFAGKRIIAERSPAWWWIGRELAALGSSEVANAASGRVSFDRITIPVGPVRFHFEPRRKRLPSPTIDFASTVAAVVVSTRAGSRIGIDESLATGTLVFIVRDKSMAIGGNAAGVITLSEIVPDGNFPRLESKRSVISHEMIHSAQYDFILTAWADPIQKSLVRKLHLDGRVTRYVDFNLLLPLQMAANSLVPYKSRPWEKEARLLVSDDK
jgi:hypothetical protein